MNVGGHSICPRGKILLRADMESAPTERKIPCHLAGDLNLDDNRNYDTGHNHDA